MPTQFTSIPLICDHCGETFFRQPHEIARRISGKRYCSRQCYRDAQLPYADAFWSKVAKSDGCWLWQAGTFPDGYGMFRQKRANRIAWELIHGAIPDGLMVLHNCPTGDNPLCVNPAHLWLGTHQENMRDMVGKGRSLIGDRNPSRQFPERQVRGEQASGAVLTERDVIDIRRRMATGEITQRAIAQEYGVSKHAIYAIVRRKTWRHI